MFSLQLIIGEVWKVDQSLLTFLDEFEGEEYERRRIHVKPKGTGEAILECWCYFYKHQANDGDLSQLPTYRYYDSYGSHGLPYVTE